MRRIACVVFVLGCGNVKENGADAPGGGDGGPPPKAPTFIQPARQFSASYGTSGGVAVADLNGDGKVDVATFSPGNNSGVMTSFLSDGQGGFPTVLDTSPGSGSTGVAIATGLMGNNTMGAAIADGTGGASLYTGDAAGQMSYFTNYNFTFPTQTIGQAVAMAPLDGGAKSWIIEGTDQMVVTASPAAGTNYNTPGQQYLMGVSVVGLALGHLASATTPDLAAVGDEGSAHNAYVLLNNGSGVFGLPQTLPLPGPPKAVALGAVAGGINVIVVGTANQIVVFTDDGHGTFAATPAHTLAAQATVTGIALADFNGDGKLDPAASSTGSDEVAIYTGNGDASFNAPAVFSAGQAVQGIAVADFTGDQQVDVVVSGFFGIYELVNTTN